MNFFEAVYILHNNPSCSLVMKRTKVYYRVTNVETIFSYVVKCGDSGILRKVNHQNLIRIFEKHREEDSKYRINKFKEYMARTGHEGIYSEEVALTEWEVVDPNLIYDEEITKEVVNE